MSESPRTKNKKNRRGGIQLARTGAPRCLGASSDDTHVHPALEEFFGYCLMKASIRYRVDLNEALSKHGLIAPHIGILTVLKASGSLSQIALGEELGIDKATMVKLLDTLEAISYVERGASTEDRRIKLIQLTLQGRRAQAATLRIAHQVSAAFLAPLSSSDRKTLRRAVPKLVKGSKES